MTMLFISHSSADRGVAESIAATLRGRGFSALFLDIDPDQGLTAGQDWERELYRSLKRSDGLIFVASEASVSSVWCSVEAGVAKTLNLAIIPVQISPTARSPLLQTLQHVDISSPRWVDRLLAGLDRAGLTSMKAFSWDTTRPPFPGLSSFGPDDAAVFFGRDEKIEEIERYLEPIALLGAPRFVTVIGPSASGKSSLVRAGVLPRLARKANKWVILQPIFPGSTPVRNLAVSLCRGLAANGTELSLPEVESLLKRGAPELSEIVDAIAQPNRSDEARSDRTRNVLLFIDQAEELVTRTGTNEHGRFLELISQTLTRDNPLWIISTLRSEFLGRSPGYSSLTEHSVSVALEPLQRSRLPEVILGPARRGGLDFEAGLAERMAEETTGGDAVPLLAYTLAELAQRAGADRVITFDDYNAVGGVLGALQRRADSITDELTRRGHVASIIPTLMKLAAVDDNGQVVRRRLSRTSLTKAEEAVIASFLEARLLTSRNNDADPNGGSVVEVTHEALLRQWAPLRDAIDDSAESLRLRSQLDRLSTDWAQGGHEDSYLLRGSRLLIFETLTEDAQENGAILSNIAAKFLEASQRSQRADHRTARRRQILFRAAGVVLVLLLAGTVVALQQRNQALTERAQAITERAQILADRNKQIDSTFQDAAGIVRQLCGTLNLPPQTESTCLERTSREAAVLSHLHQIQDENLQELIQGLRG